MIEHSKKCGEDCYLLEYKNHPHRRLYKGLNMLVNWFCFYMIAFIATSIFMIMAKLYISGILLYISGTIITGFFIDDCIRLQNMIDIKEN